MRLILRPTFLFAVLTLSGCAASYKPIKPEKLTYPRTFETSDLKLIYEYDVLSRAKNKKYAKKERTHLVNLVAVDITNKTDRPLTINEDVKFYSGARELNLMSPQLTKAELKQIAPLYLLWSLFWVVIYKCEDKDCDVTPIPIGLGIGLLNTAIASGANKNLLNELTKYDVIGKVVQPGETLNGLIAFGHQPQKELRAQIVKTEN